MSDPGIPRVLLVDMNDDGTTGGSQQCLVDIARALDRTRYEPVALFYQDTRHVEVLRSAGIETYVWKREPPARPPFKILQHLRTVPLAIVRRYRFLKQCRISIVHLNNSPFGGYDDWLPAAKLRGIPCLTHVRAQFRLPSRAIWHALASRFDRVLSISDEMYAESLRAGIDQHRLVRIYDGIDADAFAARVVRSRSEVRAELGVPDDAILLGMVGHLRPWKGQHVVLQALAAMPADARAKMRLAIVGAHGRLNAAYIKKLTDLSAELGLDSIVNFLGERGDVPDVMNASDVIVHASTIPEPFGLVVVEGMALSKPVVASNTGGPAEIITPGAGITFDPGSPESLAKILTDLAGDPELRARLGAGGRKRVNDFSLTRNVSSIAAEYDRVLHRGEQEEFAPIVVPQVAG